MVISALERCDPELSLTEDVSLRGDTQPVSPEQGFGPASDSTQGAKAPAQVRGRTGEVCISGAEQVSQICARISRPDNESLHFAFAEATLLNLTHQFLPVLTPV